MADQGRSSPTDSLNNLRARPIDLGATEPASEQLPTYREHLGQLKQTLNDFGFLALLLVDVSDINRYEQDFGSRVYDVLMGVVRDLVIELRGRQLREKDIIALNEKAGDIFLIFLMPRKPDELVTAEDLDKVANRIYSFLRKRVTRSAFPILRKEPEVSVGTALVLRNPLIREERLILRSIEEAKHAAASSRHLRRLHDKQELQCIILKKEIETVFQPIFDLRTGKVHGFEALARGPKHSLLRNPKALFDRAEKSDLLPELDHLCRRRALQSGGRLERQYKLFINTYPFAVRDPSFQGKYLIDLFEGTDLSPEQIVLEVTEKQIINNYPLFVDAMKYFSDMRCMIAIDDMGAGYSGFEQIVHLRPHYVKLDMNMVQDIDTSFIKQQILRAFRSMAEKIDAKLIAEGVETREEMEIVREIGADFIQGHLLAKPSAAFQTSPNIKL